MYLSVIRMQRLEHPAAPHTDVKPSWRELGPWKEVQFTGSRSNEGHRSLSKMLLEAHRAKGTLAVFPLAFITAFIRQSYQVGGWQDILGNVVPVIQSQAREGKVEERIGKRTSQMAWSGRMQV